MAKNKLLMKYLPPVRPDGSVRFGNAVLLGALVFVLTVGGVFLLGLFFGRPMPIDAVIPAAGLAAALFPVLAITKCRLAQHRR